MKENLDKIHQASMEILNRVGIRFLDPQALDLLKKNSVKVSGSTAFFTEEQVMASIAKAPGSFTLSARNPAHDMVLGRGETHYGAGYGCPSIITANGTKRSATFNDYLTFVKLVHQSPRFKINGGIIVQPEDIPAAFATPLMIWATVNLSDKVILGIPGTAAEIEKVMAMGTIVFHGRDSFVENPRILTLVNTLSPLQIDANAIHTIKVVADYGQALIISPGPMAGATGPVTLAGNIAQGNAEALAAITFAQMVKPGTPVVYGLQATTADLRTGGISIGSPGFAIQSRYCSALARRYCLPSRNGGTSNDAKCVSVQSGYESMLAMLSTRQSRTDFILHSAGILESYGAMSYEQFIVDLEIMDMIDYLMTEQSMDADALGLDAIDQVGPGGQFLTSPHTMKHCRNVPFISQLSHNRPGTDTGKDPHNLLVVNSIYESMRGNYKRPHMDRDVTNDLKHFLQRLGISSKLMEFPDEMAQLA